MTIVKEILWAHFAGNYEQNLCLYKHFTVRAPNQQQIQNSVGKNLKWRKFWIGGNQQIGKFAPITLAVMSLYGILLMYYDK